MYVCVCIQREPVDRMDIRSRAPVHELLDDEFLLYLSEGNTTVTRQIHSKSLVSEVGVEH